MSEAKRHKPLKRFATVPRTKATSGLLVYYQLATGLSSSVKDFQIVTISAKIVWYGDTSSQLQNNN